MPHYCSKGHENPPGSRFCLQCGEKLEKSVNKGIYPGLTLGDRYRLVRQLGQGGFGRTYLAEDTNRFSEPCVLKEFAPQVQGTYALQKAEELFEREAGVLYKLQHLQIPRFRELFRVNVEGIGYLFLVQDYVEGQTYYALLEARKQQKLRFNEAECTAFLLQILPVLEYIHLMGVIHRDISPDNLILRSSDQLPVLIDFGGVKQVAATVASQFNQPVAGSPSSPVTLLGKPGYAPPEQMQMGTVYPHSDLYALAVTVLVLLTGKEPQELIDDYTLSWNWRREVNLSSIGAVLDKMLSPRRGDRYQSAHQVLEALTSNLAAPGSAPTQPSGLPTQATLAVAPSPHRAKSKNSQQFVARVPAPTPGQPSNSSFTPGKILLVLLLLTGAAGVGWWAGNRWIQSRSTLPRQNQTSPHTSPSSTVTKTPEPKPTLPYPTQEDERRQALFSRGKELGIDEDFLFAGRGLVNQVFYSQHPERRQRPLTNASLDADLRSQWYKTADTLLDTLDVQLSPEARRQLGRYTASSRDRAAAEVNKQYVSSRALNDLTDAAFFQLFPQPDNNFINQPIGQVWQAIAADKVKAIVAGTALERIVFDAGSTSKDESGTLKPGEGKIYIAELAKEQLMKLDLQANSQVLLSVYSPTRKTKILEDSTERAWSGELPEQGFYEFVVVSTASEPVDYQLNVTAENPTPVPSLEPSPPDTPTPSPS